MVERVHRQLKAALSCYDTTNWIDALPTVLLGMRSAFKDAIQATSSELVYGQTLRLPGQYFENKEQTSPSEFVKHLRSHIDKLVATPASNHKKQKTFMPMEAQTCSHVFVRRDAIRRPLQPAYDGPYLVTRRHNNNTIDTIRRDKSTTINIARVKPAFILREPPNQLTATPTVYVQAPSQQTEVTSTGNGDKDRKVTIATPTTIRYGRQTRLPARFPN